MSQSTPPSFPELSPPRAARRRLGAGRSLQRLMRWGMALTIAAFLLVTGRNAWNSAHRPLPRPDVINDDLTDTTTPAVPFIDPTRSAEPATERSVADADLPALLSDWRTAVVAIESRDLAEKHSHGAGFIVAGSPLVATSLHVATQCTEAYVRFADDTRYAVAGYVALDLAHDLALLALRDAPPHLKSLPLATGTKLSPGEPLWAIGHPQGNEFLATDGKLLAVLNNSHLPLAARAFIERLAPHSEDLAPQAGDIVWIVHSALLAEGSSGGPVLNRAGEVVGVNTWIDSESHTSYAVDVRYVRTLLSHGMANLIEPLNKYATAETKSNDERLNLSATRLRWLLEQGRGMRWQPQTERDYHLLQQLAWAITVARLPDALAMRGKLGDRLDDLARAADTATAVLSKEKWSQPGQVLLLNELAAADVSKPQSGQFFFATIDDRSELAGQAALVATLAGYEQKVLLTVENQLVLPSIGGQCLVVGVNVGSGGTQGVPVIVPGAIVNLGEARN